MTSIKPELRGLLSRQIKRSLIGTFVVCVSVGLAIKIGYNDVNKAAYQNFYKNYDIHKEFERMRQLGVFDSCPPDA